MRYKAVNQSQQNGEQLQVQIQQPFSDCNNVIIANLKDSIGRMKYTYKTHEKAADKYSCLENLRKICVIILTSVTSASFITTLFDYFGQARISNLISGITAFLAVLTSFAGDYLDYSNRRDSHKRAGVAIRTLFVRYEDHLSDYLPGEISTAQARKIRDEYRKLEEPLLAALPRTTKWDYFAADKALQSNEKPSENQDALETILLHRRGK